MLNSLILLRNKNIHMAGLVGKVFVLGASLVAEFPSWIGFERPRVCGFFVLRASLVELNGDH